MGIPPKSGNYGVFHSSTLGHTHMLNSDLIFLYLVSRSEVGEGVGKSTRDTKFINSNLNW